MEIKHFLNGSDEGAWHTLPSCKGKDNPVEIRVKTIKPIRQRELRKKSEFVDPNGKQSERKVDTDFYYDLMRSEFILDWRNIEREGVALPCNDENKKMLDDNWREFNIFWNGLFANQSVLENALLENDLKN